MEQILQEVNYITTVRLPPKLLVETVPTKSIHHQTEFLPIPGEEISGNVLHRTGGTILLNFFLTLFGGAELYAYRTSVTFLLDVFLH